MSQAFEKVLRALGDRVIRRNGVTAQSKCPAHNDRQASLAVKVGEKAVLVKCHAGCALKAVLDAVGLKMSDISAPRERPQGRIVATYPYVDEAGKLLYEVLRYDPKDFRQRRPDPSGGWQWGLGDTPRVLYRLPAVLAAKRRIFVVEGEKDVHTLGAKGFIATTNMGGAEKWLPQYTEALRSKAVVIVPDNDSPGRAHAHVVAAAIAETCSSVRVLELPDLPPKGDVTDWFDAGGTAEQLEALARDVAPVLTLARLHARIVELEREVMRLRSDAAPF